MKRTGFIMQLLSPVLRRISALISRRLRNRFYLYLAAMFSLAAILDASVFHLVGTMNVKTFDFMVKNRLLRPAADPEIVIVDIDEASLSAMAKDYGRWPWPRMVLGEFLEHLEMQNPGAVVFDILFSDPDIYNPDSDAYFNEAIAATDNTFFPMLRLPQESDRLSEIRPYMIPGVTPMGDAPQKDATVAMVLPHLPAAIEGGRLGTHNIYPDKDGIVRRYRIYRDDYGWMVPSLPLAIARELKLPMPTEQDVILNWRGKPFSYRYVSFSKVYDDFLRRDKQRPADEFTGKVVLIGSTAPSLFDIKATSMDRLHPGVEILATAIDNIKHEDYLRIPSSVIPYLILTLIIVWATAAGFYVNIGLSRFDRAFALLQFLLVAISFASINFTTWYIDLTAPVTMGLAFFSLSRVYAAATEKALEIDVVSERCAGPGIYRGVLMLVRISRNDGLVDESLVKRVRMDIKRLATVPVNVDVIRGEQKGVWGALEGMMALFWAFLAEEHGEQRKVEGDIAAISAAIGPLVKNYGKSNTYDISIIIHETVWEGNAIPQAAWGRLLAGAMDRMYGHSEEGQGAKGSGR